MKKDKSKGWKKFLLIAVAIVIAFDFFLIKAFSGEKNFRIDLSEKSGSLAEEEASQNSAKKTENINSLKSSETGKNKPDYDNLSGPEKAWNNYMDAYDDKNLDLLLSTISKKSLEKMESEPLFNDFKDTSKWDAKTSEQNREAGYEVVEINEKYAIMTPLFRLRVSSVSEEELQMSDLYFIYEDDSWRIDFIAVITDAFSRLISDSETREKEINRLKSDWTGSFKTN